MWGEFPTQFGDNYLVQVYAAAPGITNAQTVGTKLFGAGSGADDTWFFDYQSGVLNFNGATIPAAIGTGTANTIYVVGYRYVGEFGVDTTFISNGTSNVTIASANANITMSVNGTGNVVVIANTGAYVSGAVSVSGNITGGNIMGGANVNATTLTGTTASLSGNVTGGNIVTGGLITATGNVTGANVNASLGVFAGTNSTTRIEITGDTTNPVIQANGAAGAGLTFGSQGTGNVLFQRSGSVTEGINTGLKIEGYGNDLKMK